jgi:hypothetical protein
LTLAAKFDQGQISGPMNLVAEPEKLLLQLLHSQQDNITIVNVGAYKLQQPFRA